MVELFEQNIRKPGVLSSKGNQLKWENNNIWYKADYTGYEGLAEYVVSHLLHKSSLKDDEYVIYDLEQIKYKHTIYNGVRSKSFLKGSWQIITLERLFKNMYNNSLNSMLWSISDIKERMQFLEYQVGKITGLKDFGLYLNKMFTIDAFFLNEDRHTHNIAVLVDADGRFDYCPMFDHGASLLADTTMDYPMGEDVYSLMKEVKSKTLCTDFDEQLDVSEILYGNNISFHFTKNDVRELLDSCNYYSDEIKKRVATVLYCQMDKYSYLFS